MWISVDGERKEERPNIYLCQASFENSTRIVYSSSLPQSMQNEYIHFAASCWEAKLLTGPTAPNPGPTFPSVVATALKDVIRSCPVADTAIDEKTKINTYKTTNVATEVTILFSIFWSPTLTVTAACGWINLFISAAICLKMTWIRMHLMDPAVEPAHPPMNIRDNSST